MIDECIIYIMYLDNYPSTDSNFHPFLSDSFDNSQILHMLLFEAVEILGQISPDVITSTKDYQYIRYHHQNYGTTSSSFIRFRLKSSGSSISS